MKLNSKIQKSVLIGLLFFLPMLSIGQLSVGMRMGMGIHGINFEPALLMQNQVSFSRMNYGVVAIFNNAKNAGLQLEINFAQKGWLEKVDSIGGFFQRELNYIEIPAYSHFEIGRKLIRPIIKIGPYVGIRVKDESTQEGFDLDIKRKTLNYYIKDSRKIDLGIKGGLGIRVNIGKNFAVYVEGHYDLQALGGMNIFKGFPERMGASRLTEVGGTFGVLWHIVPQKPKKIEEIYEPKEILREYDF